MTTADQPSLLPQITQQQANKSVTANDQANQIDKIVCKVLELDIGDADTVLTTAEAVGFFELRITGTQTAARSVSVPERGTPGSTENIFLARLVTNDTTGGFDITFGYETGGGTTVTVPAGQTALVIGDTLNCTERQLSSLGREVIAGGATDEVLAKASGTDYDLKWLALSFLALADTPGAFGTAGQAAIVNGTGDGLVFGNPTAAVDINGATETTSVDGASDFLLLYDASASGNRKVKPNNLPGSSVPVRKDGTQVVAAPNAIDFTGTGVTVTNSSGVATVDIPGGSGGSSTSISRNAQSGNYTLVAADAGKVVEFTATATCTVPSGVFSDGDYVVVRDYSNGGTITVEGATGVTMNRVSAGSATIDGDLQSVTLHCRGSDVFVAEGAIGTFA